MGTWFVESLLTALIGMRLIGTRLHEHREAGYETAS